MRKTLVALAAGAVAFVVTKRVKDAQETKETWKASTDTVDCPSGGGVAQLVAHLLCKQGLYNRTRGLSSVGRATALQAVGQGFDPPSLHKTPGQRPFPEREVASDYLSV